MRALLVLALVVAALGCDDGEGSAAGPAGSGAAASSSSSGDAGGGGSTPGTGGAGGSSAVIDALEARMEKAREGGFSGAVAVSQQGNLIFSQAHGNCIRETQTPCTVETVFDIGSLTKQFTAAAIMVLVDGGQLAVDQPLSDFFPTAPPDKAPITLHQLLTHTAGLPDVLGDDYEAIDRQAFLDLVFATPLVTPPGRTHLYSNVGYSILGAILEVTTGGSYEEALATAALGKAGLERTGYLLPDWSTRVVAHGYREDRAFGSPLDHPWDSDGPYWHLRANGGLLSTAGDMLTWHEALLGTEVLSDAAKTAMFTPYVEEEPGGGTFYGYGWVVEDTEYGKLVWHNGGNDYFFADLWRYLDAGVTVFVASNAYWEYVANDYLASSLAKIVLTGG